MTSSMEMSYLRQQGGVDLDVPLLEPFAVDVDAGDAGHAQQVLADLPVGDGRQLDQVELVGRHADLHDAAGGGQGGHHPRRAGPGGDVRRDLSDALLDELPGARLVGALVEDQPDRGELGDGFRAHLVEPGQAVEGLLDGHRDELTRPRPWSCRARWSGPRPAAARTRGRRRPWTRGSRPARRP